MASFVAGRTLVRFVHYAAKQQIVATYFTIIFGTLF